MDNNKNTQKKRTVSEPIPIPNSNLKKQPLSFVLDYEEKTNIFDPSKFTSNSWNTRLKKRLYTYY